MFSWVCFPMAEDAGHILCLWSTRGQTDDGKWLVSLHLGFWPTSLARLHVTKGNMCYASGFLSLNKALPNFAQIDVCSIHLDPLFAISPKRGLETI